MTCSTRHFSIALKKPSYLLNHQMATQLACLYADHIRFQFACYYGTIKICIDIDIDNNLQLAVSYHKEKFRSSNKVIFQLLSSNDVTVNSIQFLLGVSSFSQQFSIFCLTFYILDCPLQIIQIILHTVLGLLNTSLFISTMQLP